MISSAAVELVRAEKIQSAGRFLEKIDIDSYMAKLSARSEVLELNNSAGCAGFVAFYCNDLVSRTAFISLVLIHPKCRGTGLGKALVAATLNIARIRAFASCGLEVSQENTRAIDLYRSCGFEIRETRADRYFMAIDL